MDRLSAHLDRGWDLLDQGDFRGAKTSARRALALSKSSPEATNLLGRATLMEGDLDAALELFRSAFALDDGYVDAFLNAAEVLISRGELDEALSLCDEVLEFAEHPDDRADAVLLQVDALLDRGEPDAARRAMSRLPEDPLEAPHFSFLIGRAWLDLGDLDRAEPLLSAALNADPGNPDVHFYLGLAYEQRREFRRATLALLESAALEARLPRAPWSLPIESFRRTTERALAAVDPALAAKLTEALLIVTDAPGAEVIAEGIDPRAAVLIEGLAPAEDAETKTSTDDTPRRDDALRLFVYQRGIERRCLGVEDLESVITQSIEDEARALLGLDRPPSQPDEAPAASTTAPQGRPATEASEPRQPTSGSDAPNDPPRRSRR